MVRTLDYATLIAKASLEIGADKLRPNDPFQWASGFRMPIYNDNRMHLFHPHFRRVIVDGLIDKISDIDIDVIAGTATAGIPWASFVSDRLNLPMVYIRDKPKSHGLRNQIEGIDADSNLEGYRVLVVEDLISTGGSSAKAVQIVRNAEGECNYCVSIFTYEFDEAGKIFRGEAPYDRDGNKLSSPCETRSVLGYRRLVEVAGEEGYTREQDQEMLAEWRKDAFGWGEKHGFPRVT